MTPTYTLLVAAASGGLKATAVVVIEVLDVNERPVFDKEVYEVRDSGLS